MAKKAIRPIRIEGNVAYVPLSRGFEAVIDAADVHLVDSRNWHANPGRGTFYAVSDDYERRDGHRFMVRVTQYMHRIILGISLPDLGDHIDGDGLNNRRSNLRAATPAQNSRNARIRSDNKVGLKGVCFDRRRKSWKAQIRVNGKNIQLGNFATPESAHEAYCRASANLHGEFGQTQHRILYRETPA